MINTNEYNTVIKRESCKVCQKFILTYNRIIACQQCKVIYHAECSQNNLQYSHLTGQWFCKECINDLIPKYNPFDGLKCDKYDQFDLQQIADIETISKILNSFI